MNSLETSKDGSEKKMGIWSDYFFFVVRVSTIVPLGY